MSMIDGDVYISRFIGIYVQFDLAMRAVEGFKGSKEAIEKYAVEEMQRLRDILGEASKSSGIDLNMHWAFSEEGSKKYSESLKADLPSQLEKVVNRMRQNKLILMVTLLESFLKDVHREVLRQNPRLLNPDRQVPLGKLVATSLSAIIEEEIERDVQILDRKSVEQKADYFNKRLNISWFDGTIVPLVEPVMRMRNKILHEDPDAHVSENDLKLAHVVCFALPIACVMQAGVLYPKGFKWGDTKLDGMRAIMSKQGRLK